MTGVFVCIRAAPDGVTWFDAVRTRRQGTGLPPDVMTAVRLSSIQTADRVVFFGADGGVWLVKDKFAKPSVGEIELRDRV